MPAAPFPVTPHVIDARPPFSVAWPLTVAIFKVPSNVCWLGPAALRGDLRVKVIPGVWASLTKVVVFPPPPPEPPPPPPNRVPLAPLTNRVPPIEQGKMVPLGVQGTAMSSPKTNPIGATIPVGDEGSPLTDAIEAAVGSAKATPSRLPITVPAGAEAIRSSRSLPFDGS